MNGRVLWQSDVATVILGDAREVLAELATESVDLVVADPPYGVEWQSNLRAERFAMLDEDGADQRGGGVAARLRKGSVLTYPRATGRNVRHPTEKPVALLAEMIESSTRAGELVLDPCAGSGSTGVAAIWRGRRTLLIESHEPYAAMAVERVRAVEAVADQLKSL